jgi:biotin carboxyl carrier protein
MSVLAKRRRMVIDSEESEESDEEKQEDAEEEVESDESESDDEDSVEEDSEENEEKYIDDEGAADWAHVRSLMPGVFYLDPYSSESKLTEFTQPSSLA